MVHPDGMAAPVRYLDSCVTLKVSDMGASDRFYRRILGLLRGRVVADEWIEFHAPGVTIGLHPGGPDDTHGLGSSIGLEVAALDEARSVLAARGVQFTWSKDDAAARIAGFFDPDGYPLYLFERVVDVAQLGDRFEDALAWTARLHRNQRRKGDGGSPYVSHLLAVASLVLEHGGGEDEAIAALLHDAVEDQGGAYTLEAIRGRYGDRVAGIVIACTDTDEDPKPPWRRRKEAYLAGLPSKSAAAHLVSACDKLHNATKTAEDLERDGEGIWTMFNAGADEQRWWYRSLYEAFAAAGKAPPALIGKLRAAVLRLGIDLDS